MKAPDTGENIDVPIDQMYQLAEMGLKQVYDEQQKPEPELEPELKEDASLEDQFKYLQKQHEKLEKDMREDKASREKIAAQVGIEKTLENVLDKHPLTKDDRELWKSVAAESLALAANSREKLEVIVKRTLAGREKIHERWSKAKIKRTDANTKLGALVNRTARGGTGVPQIDTERVYKAEDLKSGKSTADMLEYLQRMKGE